jgi:hypothetical protein
MNLPAGQETRKESEVNSTKQQTLFRNEIIQKNSRAEILKPLILNGAGAGI